MKDVVETFDKYAEYYDRWFDTPEGKVVGGSGFVCILARKLEN